MQKTQTFRFKHVLLTIAAGFITVMALATVYHEWRKRNGWCIRFYPDGKEQVLYGGDCWK